MFKNSFSFYHTRKTKTTIVTFMSRRKQARIHACATTEFVFCKRKFGAVIIDASESGMKLSCEIKLGVGSVIHLVDPAVSGKIVWRNDKDNSIGIEFIKTSLGQDERPFADSQQEID